MLTEEEVQKLGEKVRKENRQRSLLSLGFVFLILIGAYVCYKAYVGEFIPFIHQTKTTKAKIIKVTRYNWGKGVYKYIMTYEFNYKNIKYTGKYDLWDNVDKVNDSVLIEYAIHKPKLNQVK